MRIIGNDQKNNWHNFWEILERIIGKISSIIGAGLKTLHLVTIEGRLKCLLLLYKWLIQPYLSLLWLFLATHFITRVTPIDDIEGKSHKAELKSSRNYSTNHL